MSARKEDIGGAPYGVRRTYQKIDIYRRATADAPGKYLASTTWARTRREAREKFAEKSGGIYTASDLVAVYSNTGHVSLEPKEKAMSRFYMVMSGGKSGSERLTRRAYSDAHVIAAGWGGAVTTRPYVGPDGKDYVRVVLGPWEASGGDRKVLYDGPLDAHVEIEEARVKQPA